ncbi:hypothetical protein J3F82_002080, partial [Coemansia sp. RSA 637]
CEQGADCCSRVLVFPVLGHPGVLADSAVLLDLPFHYHDAAPDRAHDKVPLCSVGQLWQAALQPQL